MTTHTSTTAVSGFLERWTAAETAGDPAAVAECLAEDFRAVGPLGFELTRSDWVQRHAGGLLTYRRFVLDEVRARPVRDATAVIARQHVEGTYRGAAVPSELRATVVVGDGPVGPRLRHLHLSFVAGTPGAPDLPSR
jgi:ketosteroid isomerase-like protein